MTKIKDGRLSERGYRQIEARRSQPWQGEEEIRAAWVDALELESARVGCRAVLAGCGATLASGAADPRSRVYPSRGPQASVRQGSE